MNNVDLGFLKQKLHDLKDVITNNTRTMEAQANELHIANLLKMLELGLISKENIVCDRNYQEYTKNLKVNNPTKKSF